MRTTVRALLASLLAVLVLSTTGVASAQYEPGGGDDDDEEPTSTTVAETSSTTASTVEDGSTTTSRPNTTTTNAPPASTQTARVTNDTPSPGSDISLIASPTRNQAVFDGAKPVAAGLAPSDGGRALPVVPTLQMRGDGTAVVTFTVPRNAPEGLFIAYAVGTAPDLRPHVIVADIVVKATGVSAARVMAEAQAAALQRAATQRATLVVPASVRAIASITPQREAELIEAVVEDGAEVLIEGENLVLRRSDSGDGARPLVAVAGGGIVLIALATLRRRPMAVRRRR